MLVSLPRLFPLCLSSQGDNKNALDSAHLPRVLLVGDGKLIAKSSHLLLDESKVMRCENVDIKTCSGIIYLGIYQYLTEQTTASAKWLFRFRGYIKKLISSIYSTYYHLKRSLFRPFSRPEQDVNAAVVDKHPMNVELCPMRRPCITQHHGKGDCDKNAPTKYKYTSMYIELFHINYQHLPFPNFAGHLYPRSHIRNQQMARQSRGMNGADPKYHSYPTY